jgi:hypothetical protein
VAVKWLKPWILGHDRESILRELRILRSIRHPHVVQYLGTAIVSHQAAAVDVADPAADKSILMVVCIAGIRSEQAFSWLTIHYGCSDGVHGRWLPQLGLARWTSHNLGS